MDEYENHPSENPEALLEHVIKAISNAGDTVLAPFTTLAVGMLLGRNTIGMEYVASA